MPDTDQANRERMITTLLLMALVLVGVILVREGVHYDNMPGGDRLFIIALCTGAILGFVGWTRYTGITPALSFSGPQRQLWLATGVAALLAVILASYVNRTFATPTDRSRVAAIDSVREGRGTRWHVIVKGAAGGYDERYSITEQAAQRLKDAKAVRMHYARGILGFDFIAEFEPAPQ